MTSAVVECRDPSSNPMQGAISFSLLLFAINKANAVPHVRSTGNLSSNVNN